MARSTPNSKASQQRPSIFTTQPWEAIKWFWRFSRFYGSYNPGSLTEKHQLTKSSL